MWTIGIVVYMLVGILFSLNHFVKDFKKRLEDNPGYDVKTLYYYMPTDRYIAYIIFWPLILLLEIICPLACECEKVFLLILEHYCKGQKK